MGNVLTRTERNNHLTASCYGAIYWLIASERQAASTATPSWCHLRAYVVDSNRTTIAYPDGSPAPATSGGYDIRERLLSPATSAKSAARAGQTARWGRSRVG